MFDHIMFVLDVLLLVAIVAQGEAIRYYEKEVWRMNAERFDERKKWRLEKQEQQRKKTAPKTSDFVASTELPLPNKTKSDNSKTTDAKPAA